jgi:predicted kinase
MVIVVLMGAPGAGKSTWLKSNKEEPFHIASTQAIRVNREIDRAAYMRAMQINAIKAAESGMNLYCDGTHTIASHRMIWLNLAKRLGVESRLVCFQTSLELLLKAQRERLYPAPWPVVISHHKRLQRALVLCKEEGWDSIETMVRR